MASRTKSKSRRIELYKAKRRTVSVPRQIVKIANRPHAFVRGYEATALTDATTYFEFEYNLANIVAVTEFSNLFDLYRIKKAVVTFIPLQNTAEASVVTGPAYKAAAIPTLWKVNDTDGDGPATALEFLERGSRPISLAKTVTHTCYPRIAKTVYNTPTSAYGLGKKNVWINMADTSVPHYGTYCFLDNVTSGSYWNCKVYVQIFFECKGIR